MNISLVNTNDISGGAARAAYRLHQALQRHDVNSSMLVQRKDSDDSMVFGPTTAFGKAMRYASAGIDALPKYRYRARSRTWFSVGYGGRDLVSRVQAADPEVVHLHWINGGFISVKHLSKIDRPMVWSLHDMWAFTGGCHYTDDGCEGYVERCGNCPVLGSHRRRDLSRRIWERKRKFFERIPNLTVVGLSSWLRDEAARSSLFSGRRIINLPNPIDSQTYRPIDRSTARTHWNVPEDASVLAFGAPTATSDPRKGHDLLVKAVAELGRNDIHVIVFGASAAIASLHEELPFPVHYTGPLHDDESLVTLYNAADVTVVPSRQENLSNTVMESLACGTPVVGFSIGGNGDMIEHKQNGYLAEPYETDDLAEGIRWVLADTDRREALRGKAREKVLDEFDYPVVAQKYEALYREILGK